MLKTAVAAISQAVSFADDLAERDLPGLAGRLRLKQVTADRSSDG
jgi:hypothetical protein